MTSRQALTYLSIGRLLFAIGMLVAPERVAKEWIGSRVGNASHTPLVRAVGGREVAYSIGAITAARSGRDPRPWLAASLVVDGTDAVGLIAEPGVSESAKRSSAAVAAGTALIHVAALFLGDDD